MSTPNLDSLFDEVTPEALRRLARLSSLQAAGMARRLPEGVLSEGEDARLVIVRGVFFRKDAVRDLESFRYGLTVTLRADPENPADPFAVAVDADDVHVGFLPKEIAVDFQQPVSEGRARVAAYWVDFNRDVPLMYLLLAWRSRALVSATNE